MRQGSILSPFLFAFYMNQLSQTLNKFNIGCFIGQHCLNNILYADDICCIAPSCKGLQKLLDVCYEYAQSHDISFNCSKTKIMMFKTGMSKRKRWKRYFFCGSGSAKNPPLPLPHRREEWREKRNWFCSPS